jgi:hypothetical protein
MLSNQTIDEADLRILKHLLGMPPNPTKPSASWYI